MQSGKANTCHGDKCSAQQWATEERDREGGYGEERDEGLQ